MVESMITIPTIQWLSLLMISNLKAKKDLGVVKTVFGFHVIEILGQTDKQRALKLATLAQTIEPSEETIDQVFNTTSKFELALQNEALIK